MGGGWPKYLAAKQKCGGKKPVTAFTFFGSEYTLPTDESYHVPTGSNPIITNKYFCTGAEAIEAGFEHKAN
ncbi:hypothetical protein FJZ39_03240 [Candidatus Saccharibacteria bacterium]|nr:hypothetical protein [Candidatus Saccharibacteria bacterium]